MKSLNINIPTTLRFIRKITKFWVFISILLIALLYAYFWLNTVEEKIIGITVKTDYFLNPSMSLNIKLQDSIHFSHKNKIADVIKISSGGEISNSEFPEFMKQMSIDNEKKWEKNIKDFEKKDSIFRFKKDISEDDKRLFYFEKSTYESYKKMKELKRTIDNIIDPRHQQFLNRKEYAPNISIAVRSDNKIMDIFNYDRENKIGLFWSGEFKEEKYLKNAKAYVDKTNQKYYYETNKDRDGFHKIESVYILQPNKDNESFNVKNEYLGNFFCTEKSQIRVHLYINFEVEHSNPENVYKLRKSYSYHYHPNYVNIYHYKLPLYILSIYPEPDKTDRNKISYHSPEKLKEISEGGITLYAENMENKDRNEKINFVLASFIGVLFSILAEIGVKHFSNNKISKTPRKRKKTHNHKTKKQE